MGKKKEKWESAVSEFYQESYPHQAEASPASHSQAQPTQPRPHIPLPSQTARRTTTNGRRSYATRKRSQQASSYPAATATLASNNHCMTFNSTMGKIDVDDDVNISFAMPDMADETIPTEASTYDALIELKNKPEPMCAKRTRKAKLHARHQRRIAGWKRIKWAFKKLLRNMRRTWHRDLIHVQLFQRSLQTIEVRCGTAIVNVFLFVRWTLLSNLLISILALFCIIFPYHMSNDEIISGREIPGKNCPVKNVTEYLNQSSLNSSEVYQKQRDESVVSFNGLTERIDCCTKIYHWKTEVDSRGSITDLLKLMRINGSFENTPLFYGYYIQRASTSDYDLFAIVYVLTVVLVLFISLIAMVKNFAIGIEGMISLAEGEHHEYTNLIVAGWEHHTNDAVSADFKRKILKQGMKVALGTEKHNFETLIRSRKEKIKLTALRIVVNVIVIGLLALAAFIIIKVSQISFSSKKQHRFNVNDIEGNLSRLGKSFLPSLVISCFNLLFPLILTKLGKLIKYSVHAETTWVLVWALVIRLSSIGFAAASFYTLSYCPLQTVHNITGSPVHVCTFCDPGRQLLFHDNASDLLLKSEACWESLFADQIYKLILVDLFLKTVLTMIVEPIRLKLKIWFKNKICQKLGTMKFSIVRHSLDIIYLQVLSWLGLYFGPFIPIFALVYCFIVFHLKKFSVLHNCTEAPNTFKTSKTTITFVAAKLLAFIVVTFAIVGVIGYMIPSRGCGPFRKYDIPWEAVKEFIDQSPSVRTAYNQMASPTVTAPTVIILLLSAYFYYSVAQANKQMVETLKHLLILEGHDKQYLFARLNSLRRHSPAHTPVRSTLNVN